MDLDAEIAAIDEKLAGLRILTLKYEGAREYLVSLAPAQAGGESKKPDLKAVPHGDNTG